MEATEKLKLIRKYVANGTRMVLIKVRGKQLWNEHNGLVEYTSKEVQEIKAVLGVNIIFIASAADRHSKTNTNYEKTNSTNEEPKGSRPFQTAFGGFKPDLERID
jgi:hypothetical protein